MKKLLFFYAAAVLAVLAHGAQAFDPCHDAKTYTPIESRYGKGLLFRIEKCGSAPAYIFGTVHLDKPEVDKVAAPAYTIMQKVEAAGFEIAASPQDNAKAIARMMFIPPGEKTSLHQLLGDAAFGKLVALCRGTKFTANVLDRMQPWAAGTMLDYVGSGGTGVALDDKLQGAAKTQGKEVFGLETFQEQLGIFADLPRATQLDMLKDAIHHYKDIQAESGKLEKAYLARDAREILAMQRKLIAKSDSPQLDRMLMKRILTDRNAVMERRLLPYLKDGSLLLCIGVLHLMGSDGVLALLEKDGYFVSVVE